jgi:hypothetical protein
MQIGADGFVDESLGAFCTSETACHIDLPANRGGDTVSGCIGMLGTSRSTPSPRTVSLHGHP